MASTPVNDPVQAFVAVITPSLRLLMVGTAWAAALVPLLVLLFWMSTPTTRRQPIFIMNVLTVTMGIVIGIINIKLYATQILSFNEPMSLVTLLAYLGMLFVMPILMDCILAYRLTAVYPRRTTSKRLLAVIFVPIVTFKIARLTNIIIFMVIFSRDILGKTSAVMDFQQLWDHTPYVKIEWIFQILDNCYTSSLFLWQLWLGQSRERNIGRIDTYMTTTTLGRASKIQRLFYLALSSFVFPCIFSIVQTSIVFHNPDFFLGAYILVSNIYFEIICILFATIWAVKTHAELADQKTSVAHSDLSFRAQTGTEVSYRSDIEAREVHVSREIDVSVTSGSVELNDLHKDSWKREI
ncbi:hypothetical protein L218DRAFT_369166 [Marasmius fiardii PR-910]|nr:hypothetical protein L218DRAFT_369166 [Marasmius fiardii PR-910]